MDINDLEQVRALLKEIVSENSSRAVRIENLAEISQYVHQCKQQDFLTDLDRELISNSSANEQLMATMQEFMAGQQAAILEIKNLVKSHGDSILVHQTKCPHPENWNRVWVRLDAIENEQAATKHEFDVKRLEVNHAQDLEIKELVVKAEVSGRNGGMVAGGGVGAALAAIITYLPDLISHKP